VQSCTISEQVPLNAVPSYTCTPPHTRTHPTTPTHPAPGCPSYTPCSRAGSCRPGSCRGRPSCSGRCSHSLQQQQQPQAHSSKVVLSACTAADDWWCHSMLSVVAWLVPHCSLPLVQLRHALHVWAPCVDVSHNRSRACPLVTACLCHNPRRRGFGHR
jgi:hypothetical protein